MNNLALLLRDKGDEAAAEDLFHQVLELDRKLLGNDHPYVANTLRRLGDLRTGAGKTAQAEELFRQALDIQRKSFPEDHWEVANTKSLMGVCRVEERRYAEAESLLLSAHDVIESRLGGAHPLTRASLERIVLLYESWNKPEEAAKYRALLADVDESQ